MKKLLAVLLTIMMLTCAAAAFAEDETLDMQHDTAIMFLDKDTEYNYTLDSIEADEDYINVLYVTDAGDAMAVAIDRNAEAGYYEASTAEFDVLTVAIIYDDEIYTSSCADYGAEQGNGCEVAIAAFDNGGWYQCAVRGTLMNEDGSKSFEIVAAFDFILDGTTVTIAEAEADVPAPAPVPEEEEPAAEEENYFYSDVARVNVGGNYYEMDLGRVDPEDGMYAMFDTGDCMFAVGIYEDIAPGEYYCGEVDSEVFYCAFVSDNGSFYYGGCSDNTEDTFGSCDIIVVASGEGGLYQIAIIGELIDDVTGERMDVAGFVDFSIE